MRKTISIVVGTLLCLGAILHCAPVLADGMALSTPNTTEAFIDNFPFNHEDKFRVYNRSDGERTFQINIEAPYSDVRKWLSVDEDVFTLPPNSSKQITFDIYANEGYGGDYLVTFTPTMLMQEEDVTGGAGAYVGVGVDFSFTVHVPLDVGKQSLGEIHPPEGIIQEAAVENTGSNGAPQNAVNQEPHSDIQNVFLKSDNWVTTTLMGKDNFINFVRDYWLYLAIILSLAIVIPVSVKRRRRSQRMYG